MVQWIVARLAEVNGICRFRLPTREETSRCISSLSAPSSCSDLLLPCLFSPFPSLFRFNFPLYSFISWSYIYFLLFFSFCLLFPNPPLLYLHHLLLPSSHVSFFYIFALFSTAPLLQIPPSLLPPRHLLLSQLCVTVCLGFICLQFCLQFVYSLFLYSLFVCSSFVYSLCVYSLFTVYLFTVHLFTVHSKPLPLQSLDWQDDQHAE